MKHIVELDINTIDWAELEQQKLSLVKVAWDKTSPQHDAHHLEGILSLLDYIQDEAAKVLGDKVVFPSLHTKDNQ